MKNGKSYENLTMYLGDGILPIPDKEEELKLIRKAQAGIRRARELGERLLTPGLSEKREKQILAQIAQLLQGRNKIAERNLRLVASIARRYTNRSAIFSFFDLYQEGASGLMRAIELYDESMNTRLATYATWWIRQAIQKALIDSGRQMGAPNWVATELPKYWKITQELISPTIKEITEKMGLTEEEVRLLESVASGIVSLSSLMGEKEDGDISSFLVDTRNGQPDMEYEVQALPELFEEAMRILHPTERLIIELRFGLNGNHPHTLQEIADRLKKTRENIRQRIGRILQKLGRNKLVRQYEPVNTT